MHWEQREESLKKFFLEKEEMERKLRLLMQQLEQKEEEREDLAQQVAERDCTNDILNKRLQEVVRTCCKYTHMPTHHIPTHHPHAHTPHIPTHHRYTHTHTHTHTPHIHTHTHHTHIPAVCLQEHERATLYSDLCDVRRQLEESHRNIHQLESTVGELQMLHEEKEKRMVELQANLEVGASRVCAHCTHLAYGAVIDVVEAHT